LNLPIQGEEDILFYTPNGLEIAKGYIRVIIGERGPYVEFEERHITRENISIPKNQAWRVDHPNAYYVEYRSSDYCNVKIYEQKKTVDYANYKIGCWYISPFDMKSNKFLVLIEPLKRKTRPR